MSLEKDIWKSGLASPTLPAIAFPAASVPTSAEDLSRRAVLLDLEGSERQSKAAGLEGRHVQLGDLARLAKNVVRKIQLMSSALYRLQRERGLDPPVPQPCRRCQRSGVSWPHRGRPRFAPGCRSRMFRW